MITKLNLSSHPFRNRTIPYLLAFLLLAIAAIAGLSAFSAFSNANSRNKLAQENVEKMKEKVEKLQQKRDKVREQLTPAQKQLLVASHKLVANKSFGWSRLFADLESVLPGSVSASRISVQKIFKDEDRIKAELEFSVLSKDYPSVQQMIDKMNNSGIFQAQLRSQDLRQAETITYTEYTFFVIYAQRSVSADRPPILDGLTSSARDLE